MALGLNTSQKKSKHLNNNKDIIANIFRIQAYDSVMCEYFCIGFINFMFKSNSLIDFTIFFCQIISKKMMI